MVSYKVRRYTSNKNFSKKTIDKSEGVCYTNNARGKEKQATDKVKIKLEKEIENCYECPFTVYIYEQGFCGTCCKFNPYVIIPNKGIYEKCPFRKEKQNETLVL